MKTADLITSYLSNEMTPEQERQFLLSVAASDSLRLSLKSHVMLDKIVTNQIQRAHVPENVRDAIFTQMSSSMTGTAPLGAASAAGADALEGASLFGRIFNGPAGRFGRGALVALLTFSGFAAGYLTRSELAPAPNAVTASAPAPGTQGAAKPDAPTMTGRNAAPVAPAPAPAVTAQAGDARVAEQGSVIAEAAKPASARANNRVVPASRQTSRRESVVSSQMPSAQAESSKSSTDHKTAATPPESEAGGNGQNTSIGRSASGPKSVTIQTDIEKIPAEDTNKGGPRE